MIRIVFDTNVFIAAVLKEGLARELLELAVQQVVSLITSSAILQELQDKLQNKFKWDKEKIHEYEQTIKDTAEIITVTSEIKYIRRDLQDNKILECAVSGKADIIVSIDRDLLKLKEYQGIAIIHPKSLHWIFPDYFRK